MASRMMFWKNIFLMPKSKFKEYFNFMSRFYEAFEDLRPKLKIDERDSYQQRALSFIAERVTSAWILKQHNIKASKVVIVPLLEDDKAKSPFQRTSIQKSTFNEDRSSSNTEEREEH
jgi:hypothetical protein